MSISRTRRSWTQQQIDQIRSEVNQFVSNGTTLRVASMVVADKWRLSHLTVQQIFYGKSVYERFGKCKMVRVSAPHPTKRKFPAGYRPRITSRFIESVSTPKEVNQDEVSESDLKSLILALKKKYGITSITF